MEIKYNRIGDGYNETRKADPYLTQCLYDYLEADPQLQYLDLGCGTGNYTIALMKKGLSFIGIDPSEKMLKVAESNYPNGDWRIGVADDIGLENDSMDGAIITLTTHHWPNLYSGFKELYRVLKPGARFVVFTATPQQMRWYWLIEYFPKMIEDSIRQMPSWEYTSDAITKAGFRIVREVPYFVKADLQDLFMYNGKHDPERYFDPAIRSGISSFADIANREEIEAGLKALRADIDSGAIKSVISSYENDNGDYLHIVGEKKIDIE